MALTAQALSVINQASRGSVEKEFSCIADFWKAGCWLSSSNRYLPDPIKQFKKEKSKGVSACHSHLRQYISTSSVIHSMDGWRYLGRAIEAHLRGDSDACRHLAYYAELRAAMSILASEGIGVFDKKHFVVDKKSKCKDIPIGIGTHQFVWDAFEHWVSTQSATNLIFSTICPDGIQLNEWLDNFVMGAGFRTILSSKWLTQWGLDIKRFADDRDARNFSSYRPSAYTSPRALNIQQTVSVTKMFWEIFEPLPKGEFCIIDKYLLKSALEIYFKSTQARSHKQSTKVYRDQISVMLNNVVALESSRSTWKTFLLSNEFHQIFENAMGTASVTDPDHHCQVIARASLLLRLATGSCKLLLDELSDDDKSYLSFWVDSLGEDHCLWDRCSPPTDLRDLWSDIDSALVRLSTWCTTTGACPSSYHQLWKQSSDVVGMLGSCERIGLWGVGL